MTNEAATRNPQPATGKPQPADLIQALALREREHIALVGAGGKTSILFALSDALKGLNRKCLMSTTTKVWHLEAQKAESLRLSNIEMSWREGTLKDLEEGRPVFLGVRILESGKVQGVHPSVLDSFYRETDLDYVLVEADGAAGHPVKAYSPGEPVIPGSATMVVAIMGVEVLGKAFSPELVFRPDAFEEITRIPTGEIITSRPLSRLFIEPGGLFKSAPEGARKVVLLNKADLAHDQEEVRELTRLILADEEMHVERVVVGSMRTGEWEVYKAGGQRSEVRGQQKIEGGLLTLGGPLAPG